MKQVQKRDLLHMEIDVLKTMRDYDRPTRIMYASNLAWTRLQVILGKLIDRGLVEKIHEQDSPRFIYHLTPKAYELLDDYARIMDKIDPNLERLIFA